MSDPQNSTVGFLQRWSRRKRAAGSDIPETGDRSSHAVGGPERAATPSGPVSAFDPAVLPPIESINTASDVRAFFAPHVPVELRRAALRQLWLNDPAIRDFVGIAENQWDFTNPDAVPGFGSIELTPELRRTVEDLFVAITGRVAPQEVETDQRDDPVSEQSRDTQSIAVEESTESGMKREADVGPSPGKLGGAVPR